jgi:hypothetical protein
VTKIDFSGKVKRIRFHFVKTISKHDEWIEFLSSRIAALYSKTVPPVPKKTADKKRPVTDVALDETAEHPTSQLNAAKEPGTKNGKKKARVTETKGIMSSKSGSDVRDDLANEPNSQGKTAKEPGAKKGKKKARLNETEGGMSPKSGSVAREVTAEDQHSQGKVAKEPGAKNGKKKARLNGETKGIMSSKSDIVARDEAAEDPTSQLNAAKEPGVKNGKKKARLKETKGVMSSSNLDSVARDETAKNPKTQGKAAKEPGAKNGKTKARLIHERKANTSSNSKAVVLSENDSMRLATLNHGPSAIKPVISKKQLSVIPRKVQTATGAWTTADRSPTRFGVEAASKKKEGSLLENAYEGHDPSSNTASESPQFSGAFPADNDRSGTMPGPVAESSGNNGGVHLGTHPTNFYQHPRGQRLASSPPSATPPQLHNFTTDAVPGSSPFNQLMQLASAANVSSTTAGDSPQFSVLMPAEDSYRSGTMIGPVVESNGTNGGIHLGTTPTSFYQHPRGQHHAPSPSSAAPRLHNFTSDAAPRLHNFTTDIAPVSNPFDQLLRLASVANVSTCNESHFDNPVGQHIPQPSNGPPAGGPPFGYTQTNLLDNRSQMQPTHFPPATFAPQDPSFQRGSDGAVYFDQYRFQDRQTDNQHPPRYYR